MQLQLFGKLFCRWIEKSTKHASLCGPDILGKIEINDLNTCWYEDEANSLDNQIRLSIEIKNIELDEIIVSHTIGGETSSYEILSDISENSGKIHSKYLQSKPDSIKIIPVISGEQCEAVDSINNIPDC